MGKKKLFVIKKFQSNDGLNQYILYQNFFTINIYKHTNVAFASDIGLDILKLEITCNCIIDAFKKFNHFAFFVFKFNFPCGSHFRTYF
jgi:hypothetical protein